jgi:peptidoglycan hydrolase-like protein with peptidoglycan-binding domain/3D (Asp-Asp-Asp) domain-containing protein
MNSYKINTIWIFRLLISVVTLAYFFNASVVLAFKEIEEPLWLKESPVQETEPATEKLPVPDVTDKILNHPYTKTFIISAYYSPQPGQAKYVTGSYEGDIRLNGRGTNGADGTPVYPGMLAAPKTYPFGTKMTIPGIGTAAVHDRGGAIVSSGMYGNAYDRLDIWMGYGDIGLKRALSWGKRTVNVTVHGIAPHLKEDVILEGYDPSEKVIANHTSTKENAVSPVISSLFSRQLAIGSSGQDVRQLQEILKQHNYYSGTITGEFDERTRNAVSNFQVEKGIIQSENSFGSGHVGPKTMSILAGIKIRVTHAEENTIFLSDHFAADLKSGDTGFEVRKLQEELRRINLLGIESTGYYGEITEHAVFKFQQIHKLAGDKSSSGAGIFGPMTRSKLNEIVRARLEKDSLIEMRKS